MKRILMVLAKIACCLLAIGLMWSVVDYYSSYKSLHPVKNVAITPNNELTLKFSHLTTDFYDVYFLIHHNIERQPQQSSNQRHTLMKALNEAVRSTPLITHIKITEGSSGNEILSFTGATKDWHIGDHSYYGELNSAHKFALFNSNIRFKSSADKSYELKVMIEDSDHPILKYPISVMVKGRRDNGYFDFDRNVTYPIWLLIITIMAIALWRQPSNY